MEKRIMLVFLALFIFVGCGHKHEWIDATCTDSKICSTCGETEGEPLGHEWIQATCEKAKCCNRCGESEGEALGHILIEATCTASSKCQICGKELSVALGHEFENKSCVEANTCLRCGNVVEPEGHKWIEATCVSPKKCKECGETEGQALGHTTRAGLCDRCNEEVIEPYTGSGDDVITNVELGKGIYKAHITNNGRRNFHIWCYDSTGDKDLLVNEIGSYSGDVLLNGTSPLKFEVGSSGTWSIEISPLGVTSNDSFSGKGDYVTDAFNSKSGTWAFTHDGSHNFAVWAWTTARKKLLVNEIGVYDGKKIVEIPDDGMIFFEVTADGNWTITKID